MTGLNVMPQAVNADCFDAIIIGGGVMGCAAALRLAQGGMRVCVIESRTLGSGATGVNAGTLSLQIKRLSLLEPAIKGAEAWSRFSQLSGVDIHFRRPGGLNLAFTEAEEARLVSEMTARREAGLPIKFLSQREVQAIEPGLTQNVRMASFCAWDGYASSSVVGLAFRRALAAAGVVLREFTPVQGVERLLDRWVARTAEGVVHGSRLLVATGAWSRELLAQFGSDLPVGARINQMCVTERTAPLLQHVIGHISGLMSLKQASNGTIIVGGGWQGQGRPGEPGQPYGDNLQNNLQFACYGLPALAKLRLVRSWYGYDSFAPDHMPMAGALPGLPDAYVLACVRGGFTIGPYLGCAVAEYMLGLSPLDAAYDPARFLTAAAA